jgi:hypothetical protein
MIFGDNFLQNRNAVASGKIRASAYGEWIFRPYRFCRIGAAEQIPCVFVESGRVRRQRRAQEQTVSRRDYVFEAIAFFPPPGPGLVGIDLTSGRSLVGGFRCTAEKGVEPCRRLTNSPSRHAIYGTSLTRWNRCSFGWPPATAHV